MTDPKQPALPEVESDSDRDWERRHAGQDFSAVGLEALTCIVCGESLEYEVGGDGIGGYFCPHCRECVATGKGV
jgi:hypothetical protein